MRLEAFWGEGGNPFSLNPDYIVAVEPHARRAELTVIWMDGPSSFMDQRSRTVRGTYADTLVKLGMPRDVAMGSANAE